MTMGRIKTYTEFRDQFENVADFRKTFGALSYEEAHELVANDGAPTYVKACMMETWRRAAEEKESR